MPISTRINTITPPPSLERAASGETSGVDEIDDVNDVNEVEVEVDVDDDVEVDVDVGVELVVVARGWMVMIGNVVSGCKTLFLTHGPISQHTGSRQTPKQLVSALVDVIWHDCRLRVTFTPRNIGASPLN